MQDDLVERLLTGARFHEGEGDIGLPFIMRQAATRLADHSRLIEEAVKAEREACAKVAEDRAREALHGERVFAREQAQYIAASIRGRG